MFLAAEKLHAPQALRAGLVDAIVEDPLAAALELAPFHSGCIGNGWSTPFRRA
jgi:enoyl-CoA hydratase/carnithine racemase